MTFFDRLLSALKNEREAYMVFFAILIPILFACAGLVVDLGNGFARHARLPPAEGGGSGWCRYFCYESRDCRYSSKGRCAGGNLCESELGEWESIIPKAPPGEDGGWCIVLSRPSSGVDTYDIYQICGH